MAEEQQNLLEKFYALLLSKDPQEMRDELENFQENEMIEKITIPNESNNAFGVLCSHPKLNVDYLNAFLDKFTSKELLKVTNYDGLNPFRQLCSNDELHPNMFISFYRAFGLSPFLEQPLPLFQIFERPHWRAQKFPADSLMVAYIDLVLRVCKEEDEAGIIQRFLFEVNEYEKYLSPHVTHQTKSETDTLLHAICKSRSPSVVALEKIFEIANKLGDSKTIPKLLSKKSRKNKTAFECLLSNREITRVDPILTFIKVHPQIMFSKNSTGATPIEQLIFQPIFMTDNQRRYDMDKCQLFFGSISKTMQEMGIKPSEIEVRKDSCESVARNSGSYCAKLFLLLLTLCNRKRSAKVPDGRYWILADSTEGTSHLF